MRDVLLLNATYEPLAVVSLRRAVVLVLAEKAESVEADGDGRILRSERLEVAAPAVIRLRNFIRIPRRGRVPISRRAVLLRDNYECAYCTDRWAASIDHIVPRSRGGAHHWDNVIAACKPCNGRKGDRSLRDLGWKLRFQPVEPTRRVAVAIATADPSWRPYLRAA